MNEIAHREARKLDMRLELSCVVTFVDGVNKYLWRAKAEAHKRVLASMSGWDTDLENAMNTGVSKYDELINEVMS